MVMVAEELISLHKSGVILCSFDESNIYVNRGKSVFFVDWTVARSINATIDPSLMSILSSVPSYVSADS